MKGTILSLEQLNLTFSFLAELLKDESNFFNLVEEARITLQNILILLNIKSYFSAIAETRKLIELLLWIFEIKERGIEVLWKDRLTSKYFDLINKYIPEIMPFWKEISEIIHFKKELNFNLNEAYGENNLNEGLILIEETVILIENYALEIFTIFEENEIIENYKILLRQIRIRSKFKNSPFKENNKISFARKELQKKFLKNKKINEKEIYEILSSYKNTFFILKKSI